MSIHRVIGCLVLSASVLRLSAASEGAAGFPSDLVLTLRASSDHVTKYEPLILRYEVRNPTDATVESEVVMAYPTQRLQLYVQRENGPIVRYSSGMIVDIALRGKVRHPPGEALSSEVEILYNDRNGTLAFPEPGRYLIWGKMLALTGSPSIYLESKPIVVRCEPPGMAERQFLDSVGSEVRLIALLRKGPESYCDDLKGIDCIDHLEDLLEAFGDSAYAPFVTYQLADFLRQGMFETQNSRVHALDLLKGFMEKWPHHPRTPDAMAMLIGELHAAGIKLESDRWLDEFAVRYPDRRAQLARLRRGTQNSGPGQTDPK